VRDNADLTLFTALAILRLLPAGGTVDIPGDGALRRVTIAPLATDEVERLGKLEVATAIAQWVVYDLSIWHELATWHGWESTPGFSERLLPANHGRLDQARLPLSANSGRLDRVGRACRQTRASPLE
jgi:hypothetical protein